MKRIAMMLADGFEPIEALAPTDALRRGGVEVALISTMATLEVTAAQDVIVRADMLADEADLMAFDAICVPGGSGGVDNLKKCAVLAEALPRFMSDGERLVASICAGPLVLNDLGLLAGRTATCYPGCEADFPAGVYPGQGIFVDGNLITASGPAYALDLGIAILRALAGDGVADRVAADMLIG